MADQVSVKFVEQGGQELENKIAKLEQKYRQLQQSMRDTGGAAKESGGAMQSSSKGMIENVASLAAGYVGVSKAIGFVTSAYTTWREEMKKAHEETKKLNDEMTQNLFRTGALAQGPQIRGMMRGLMQSGTPATMEQLQAAGAGLAAGSGDVWQDKARRKEAMALLGRVAPVEKNIGQYGEMVGTAMEVGGLSPEEAAGMIQTVRRLKPGAEQQIFSRRGLSGIRAFADSGAGSFSEGVAFSALAAEKDLPAAVIENLLTKASSAEINRAPPKSRADVLSNQIARLPAKDRLAAIMAAPQEVQQEMLGAKLTGGLGRFGELGDWQRQVAEGTRGGAEWKASLRTVDYQEAFNRADLARREDLQRMRKADKGANREEEIRLSNLELDETEADWLTRAVTKTGRTIKHAAEDTGLGSNPAEVVRTGAEFSNPITAPIGVLRAIRRDLNTIQATNAAQNARGNAGER